MSLEPIVFDHALPCACEEAFAVYAQRIGEWWDPRYTANAETLEAVTIEPRAGGRVYATHRDIGEHDWGEVVVWEPVRRLVHAFHLARDPQHPSEVAVAFAPAGGGCSMHFEHGGWTAGNVAGRARFGDWPALLERYAALAGAGR